MRFTNMLPLAVLLALTPLGASAQSLPDTLIWELIGPAPIEADADGVTFDLDGHLVASANADALRWMPDGTWVRAFERRGQGDDYRFEPDGDVYYRRVNSLWRTRDNGLTWREMGRRLHGADTWALTTPGGALLLGNSGSGDLIERSEDDGDTVGGWVGHDYPGNPQTEPAAPNSGFAVLPPGTPGVPEAGRIVAAGITGMAYSDDDGRTWTRSELWCPFCVYARNITRLDGGPHEGELVISLDDNRSGGVSGGVWRSADGVAWARVGRSFPAAVGVEIYPLGDGLLVATWFGTGTVRASEDGGATWRDLGPVDPREGFQVEDLERGPDGRLYAAVSANPESGGTYRTVDPVLPVAGEAEAPGRAALGLSVRPNPSSGGAVTVSLSQASPSAVRVEVLDALGRRVAVLHDGPAAEGPHAFVLNAGALAPGVYVVVARAAGGADSLARAFTVVR